MDEPCEHEFHLEHLGSVKNHLMSGMTLRSWLRLLWAYKAEIEWLKYWYRIAFLTFLSLFNTILAIPDVVMYSSAIEKQELRTDPVFILGHPRTGTTHLHNLMSLDKEQFTVCNTFQVGFPSSFLTCEKVGKKLLASMVDSTRPMDNMALTMDTPSEDEIATNTLSSGLCSPYMALVLPQIYRDTLSTCFDFSAAPKPLKEEWESTFTYFVKKLTLKSVMEHGGKGKRLLLKSPVHTGRIAILKDMFPDAKFIYIHRNPYEVFQSATNMADKYYGYCCLSTPTNKDLLYFVIHQYQELFKTYARDREELKEGELTEVTFSQLEAEPKEVLRHIYDKLDLEGSLKEEIIDAYRESLGDFKKNHHRQLSEADKELVEKHWGDSFDALGYERREKLSSS